MVFWIGILAAAAFAYIAIKLGFFETWALLFNIVVSLYLAIFLAPSVADLIPAAGTTTYGTALTVLALAAACFLPLHGLSYIFFTGRFSVSMPKLLDVLGAGLLGFLAGLLVWSFVSLLICISPLSQYTFVEQIGFGTESDQANVQYIGCWGDLVHYLVSNSPEQSPTEKAIAKLLEKAEKAKLKKSDRIKKIRKARMNKMMDKADPNFVDPDATQKEPEIGPPPDADDENI